MSLTATQIISLSAVLAGILMVVECFVIVGGKGVDLNGELPYMVFGSVFASAMPIVLQLLGPWSKSWYWYIFIAFIIGGGFMSYIRNYGFRIRIYEGNYKNALSGVEKAVRKAASDYTKETKESKSGNATHFNLASGKYPIIVGDRPDTLLTEGYVEILAPEALWNADLKHELMVFVQLSRKNRTTGSVLKGFRRKILVGVMTVFLGAYLFGLAKL